MKVIILSIIILAVILSPLNSNLIISVSAQETVTICHRPPGSPENVQTITVNSNAVQPHLDHGDTLGPCTPPPTHTATVTVTKVVNGGPNSPEDFSVCVHTDDPSVDGDVPVPATPPCAPGSGSGFTYTVKPGAIAISEPVIPPGYTHAITSTCTPGIVAAGQTTTCTLTNTFTGTS
jgi:hypothetical protein